jgi:hypothetical protein
MMNKITFAAINPETKRDLEAMAKETVHVARNEEIEEKFNGHAADTRPPGGAWNFLFPDRPGSGWIFEDADPDLAVIEVACNGHGASGGECAPRRMPAVPGGRFISPTR